MPATREEIDMADQEKLEETRADLLDKLATPLSEAELKLVGKKVELLNRLEKK